MKKLFAILLAVVLTLTMAVAVLAANEPPKPTEGNVDVSITNSDTDPDKKDDDPADVDPENATYAVTIDFTGVVFTFAINDLDSYVAGTGYTDGAWVGDTSKTIKIDNDSNTAITVTPTFKTSGTQTATLHNVPATLSKSLLTLSSAAKTGDTVSDTLTVSIDSSKKPTTAAFFTIDTVVLTIAGTTE